MSIAIFIRGIILGFSIAAPVGPIGILCIRRTLAHGVLIGFASGFGAATADAVFGIIAGCGLTLISDFLVAQRMILSLLGGSFLGYLGIKTLLAQPASQAAPVNSQGIVGAYASTFFLTLTNPMTILSYTAIFAGMGVVNTSGNYIAAFALAGGFFTGAALWFLSLSAAAGLIRNKISAQHLGWINKISGLIILIFAIFILMGALIH